MKKIKIRKILFIAVVVFVPVITVSNIAHAQGITYNPPRTYNGYPIDATPIEWNGNHEQGAVKSAANLFCQWVGYNYAASWNYTKGHPIAANGTYRFSISGGPPQYCDFCRWNLSIVTCL